jgi:hypothetical protein
MRARGPLVLLFACLLVGCGDDPSSGTIVARMISPASVSSSVGVSSDFTAAVQYIDGRQIPVANAHWSIQGSAALVMSSSGSGATVMCVRPSDYFAGGYVGDTVMASAEVKGQTYIGTASLVCR